MEANAALGGGMILLNVVSMIFGIGSLVCFVLVLVQMFKRQQTGLGIACIVLSLCGIGPLIALVYGWIKASEWNITKLMLAWTALIIVNIVVAIGGFMFFRATVLSDPEFQKQMQQLQQQ